jgi:NAD(P)-dependent dehydrogenase (short-subunit alcohol dehydrogenase family)
MRFLFDLHFFGPAALTKAVLPHMRQQGGGWVVQFSSVGGQVTAPGKDSAYFSSPLLEYAGTVGPTRAYVETGGGSQPGDPAKATRAILTAMASARPPLRLVLGGDAIDRIRERLGDLQHELAEWEEFGRATSIDE